MEPINYQELEEKANLGAFSTLDMEVLCPWVAKLTSGQVYLEVGVDKGKSLSVARMVAQPDVFIYGVDLQPDPHVPNTIFYQGDSVDVSAFFDKKVNVLFIDGDHSYQGCKRDIDAWYLKMAENGVMLFHDCDESSPGVVQAVFEFFNTHTCKSIRLFKYNGKNTSMAQILL